MNITTETKVLTSVLIVTILIIVGGALLAGRNSVGTGEQVKELERLVRAGDPVLGPQDAKVTVVEFGDFQCPSCSALHPLLLQVKEANKDKSVRFVYRNFPLPMHPDAELAAEAAEEANRQGKFWEYHDLLFTDTQALARPHLEEYAQKLNLNMDEFKQALDNHTQQAAVQQDKTDGEALNIAGTPTIFINGVKFTGTYSAAGFQDAIDAAAGK